MTRTSLYSTTDRDYWKPFLTAVDYGNRNSRSVQIVPISLIFGLLNLMWLLLIARSGWGLDVLFLNE